MKKFLFIFIILVLNIGALLFIFEVYPISDLRGKGTDILHKSVKPVLIIQKMKDCTPVSLNFYADNTYELFTEYEACKPFETCTLQLRYSKSIKGTYNYDLTKILNDKDNIEIGDNISDYKLVDYEIYPFRALGEEYEYSYVIKKGQNNKYLEELLSDLDLNLNKCAIPEYTK